MLWIQLDENENPPRDLFHQQAGIQSRIQCHGLYHQRHSKYPGLFRIFQWLRLCSYIQKKT